MERQEFTALYERLRGSLFSFAASRLSPQSALDVVHDTFEIVWAKRGEAPEDPEQRNAWCFGIARNKILQESQRVRRKHHDNRFIDDIKRSSEPASGDVADVVIESETGKAVWQSLSSADRQLLLVVATTELAGAEAAEMLGISHVAYRRRVSRLRERIHAGRHASEHQTAGDGGRHE